MRKLVYVFEDGSEFANLKEAKTHEESTRTHYKEKLVEIKPDRDIQDGISFEKAGSTRFIPGLKQVDTGNVAKRGWFKSSREDIVKRTFEDNPWLRKEKVNE